jgi:hypothetical protein
MQPSGSRHVAKIPTAVKRADRGNIGLAVGPGGNGSEHFPRAIRSYQ